MIVHVGMRNVKRVVVALTVATAALAVAGPAHAGDGPSGDGEGGINLPDRPNEIVDGVRTGLDVAATSWEVAGRSAR
ncbi:hypothetical protein GCM10010449_79050 [Streptomyces rectiviolaceus]|uniref:Secreted protein n=1 Tax=Streptomyces rectiviolaceus TaxID=332591 RepID=A0ABP6NJM5_9ACTN